MQSFQDSEPAEKSQDAQTSKKASEGGRCDGEERVCVARCFPTRHQSNSAILSNNRNLHLLNAQLDSLSDRQPSVASLPFVVRCTKKLYTGYYTKAREWLVCGSERRKEPTLNKKITKKKNDKGREREGNGGEKQRRASCKREEKKEQMEDEGY